MLVISLQDLGLKELTASPFHKFFALRRGRVVCDDTYATGFVAYHLHGLVAKSQHYDRLKAVVHALKATTETQVVLRA
jgi:hypothetical protein